MNKKGFTLIELLVVIAVIGILSSIVLVSLNSARNKGTDAKIKGQISSIRGSAELIYDNASSYATVCADSRVAKQLKVGSDTASCYNSASGWVAVMPLKAPATTGDKWCADSDGFSGIIPAATTPSATVNCSGASY